MRRPEHALIGAGFGAAAAHVLGGDPWLSMGIAAVGASIPDVDLEWANRWDRPRPGSPCKLLDHRGPLHSITAAIVLGVVLGTGSVWWLGVSFAAGYISHLLGDGLSYLGVPFLWPLSARRYRLLPYRLRVRSGTRWVELPLAAAVFWLGLILSP